MSMCEFSWRAVVLSILATVTHDVWAQSYFDELAARPDVVHAIGFRSGEEIEEYWPPNNNDDIDYDPSEDSMRFRWPEAGGANNIDTVRIAIVPNISTGNVFMTWEQRWSANWAQNGVISSVNGISTHKNFQIGGGDSNPYSNSTREIEIRMYHRKTHISDEAIPPGYVGAVDIRSYFGNTTSGDQLVGLQRDLLVKAATWHRYFVFIEYGDGTGFGKISLWVTDDAGVPRQLYDQAIGGSAGTPEPLGSFWFEHNSSQEYSGSTSYLWNRNLVILDGVPSINEAIELVSMGAYGDLSTPKPPTLQ